MNNNNFLIQPGIKDFITTPRPSLMKVLREKAYWRIGDSPTTWEELSVILNHSVEKLKEVNPKIAGIETLNPRTVILYPGKALSVSYTEEGLRFLCTNRGDLMYYNNAYYTGPYTPIRVKGNKPLKRNNRLIVEDFIPHDHLITLDGKSTLNRNFQAAEVMCVDKALRMLYVPSEAKPDLTKTLVYTSVDKKQEA